MEVQIVTKKLSNLICHAEMNELLHHTLQISRIRIHRELRFLFNIVPYHHILMPRRRRTSNVEQQAAIEARLEIFKDFPASRIVGNVA